MNILTTAKVGAYGIARTWRSVTTSFSASLVYGPWPPT
jgi:hypothetical protein